MKFPILLLFAAFHLWSIKLASQVDTEFWFAAPYAVTHQPALAIDRVLRISTFDAITTVTISQPANPLSIPTVIQLMPNNTYKFNLNDQFPMLETTPPNVVLNYGIHITATSKISAYYEITNLTQVYNNPEMFVLKGGNALGTEFYTPFQSFWNNGFDGFSGFVIVAAEDGTNVTITPTHNVVGHTAGTPFSIVLQQGQVYAVQAASTLASEHLGGSVVTSDKPIAITLFDDSATNPTLGGCGDLAGDQLIPVNQLGTEYILLRGFLNNNNDRGYIMAVEDNTQVFVGGTLVATLQTGQTQEVIINQPSMYVKTDRPVYVWHISGFGCEVGGAVLPAIRCRGSREVNFTRSNSENFGLILIIRDFARNGFVLNGNPIDGNLFSVVPATNGEWYAASLQFGTTQIAPDLPISLVNTLGLFQVGVINGGVTSGCRYGYFSDYNSKLVDLGPDLALCEGQTYLLDVFEQGAEYTWQDGSANPTFTVSQPGTYSVMIEFEGCQSADTIEVAYRPNPQVDLGPDQTLCDGATFTADVTVPGGTYLWQNGSTNPTFTISNPGSYHVTVTAGGCSGADTLRIMTLDTPGVLSPGPDSTICIGDTLRLDATQDGVENYTWNNGTIGPLITITETGLYSVTWSNDCGEAVSTPVSVTAQVCHCQVEVPNIFTPDGNGRNDRFGILSKECRFTAFRLQVFNRWGREVFATSDPMESWDGKYKGDLAPSEVYVWKLSYTDNGVETTRQGDLTLLR